MTELDLFLAALDKEPGERAAYLEGACGGDAALRQRLEALLRSHAGAPGFLKSPAAAQLAATDPASANAAPDLSFLAPSSEPGALGRLDHYEVLEVVGRGGMGVVLRARDTKLERIVAIKAMAVPLAASGTARQRFVREARAAAAVRDEHIVAIHAVCDEAPVPYLVMELIEGCSLEALLRRSGPLEVKEILRIGMQVASGLVAAHRHGLVHRDIKPANILLENGVQRVKLTDFGLARAADDARLTQAGLIAGTPLYMAPEQAAGEPIDARADLFSLGSVLYELCTGRPAFRAPTTVAVIRRVCDETPRPIREVNPDVPEPLRRLIERLHAKKRADRPASATEVADQLAELLAALSVGHVSNVPADQARWKRAPRGRWLPWAAAALVLLCAGLGVGESTGLTDVRGTVIRLFSPDGTLVVEVDDPNVSVTVDGADVVITGAGVKEIRLKPGQYRVEASKAGKVLRQDLVTVSRNGRQVVRVSKEAETPAVAAKTAEPTEAQRWEAWVAALPPEKQVKAVALRLQELNPGFDGAVQSEVSNGGVTKVKFSTHEVADVSPVRALRRLETLVCVGTAERQGKLADLSPLRGMALRSLYCHENPVADLSPLEGMPLRVLEVFRTQVKNLTPLGGMPLTVLNLSWTRTADLSPLKGLRLRTLLLHSTVVPDLAPLRGMPLTSLDVSHNPVKDLAPLQGMPLESLWLRCTLVSDLAPLRGMALKELRLNRLRGLDLSPLKGMPLIHLEVEVRAESEVAVLRSLKGLEMLNGKPAAEFWKEVDGK